MAEAHLTRRKEAGHRTTKQYPSRLDFRIATVPPIFLVPSNALVARKDILRIHLPLNLQKTVVVLLTPETGDRIWLKGVGFVLVCSALIRGDGTE